MRRAVLLAIATTAPAAAHAQGAEPKLITPPAAPAAPTEAIGWSHDGTYCGDIDTSAKNMFAPVCTGRAPMSLDFELGFGVARKIDLIAELRIGLEPDFGASPSSDGPRVFHLSPGARVFFSDGGRAKLFTTAQLVFDFSGYEDASGGRRGADFGVRNLDGLWIDLDRAYGFYAYVGDTLTVARWMRFELEAGVGIQGRYR